MFYKNVRIPPKLILIFLLMKLSKVDSTKSRKKAEHKFNENKALMSNFRGKLPVAVGHYIRAFAPWLIPSASLRSCQWVTRLPVGSRVAGAALLCSNCITMAHT